MEADRHPAQALLESADAALRFRSLDATAPAGRGAEEAFQGERLRIFAVLRRPSSDTLGQAQWLSRFGPMRLDVALVDPDPSPTTSVAASAASPLSPVSAIAAMGLPSDRRIVLRRGSVCVPTVGAGHSAGPPGAADAADTDACVVYDTDVTFSVGPDLLEKPLLLSMTLLPAESPSPALHKALRRAMNTGTAAGLYSELAKRAPGDRPRALPSRTISTQVVVLQPLVATASEALVGGTTYISVALSNTHPWRAVTVTDAQFHIRSTRPAPLGPIPTHLRAATAFLEGVEGGQGDDSVSSAELGGVGAGLTGTTPVAAGAAASTPMRSPSPRLPSAATPPPARLLLAAPDATSATPALSSMEAVAATPTGVAAGTAAGAASTAFASPSATSAPATPASAPPLLRPRLPRSPPVQPLPHAPTPRVPAEVLPPPSSSPSTSRWSRLGPLASLLPDGSQRALTSPPAPPAAPPAQAAPQPPPKPLLSASPQLPPALAAQPLSGAGAAASQMPRLPPAQPQAQPLMGRPPHQQPQRQQKEGLQQRPQQQQQRQHDFAKLFDVFMDKEDFPATLAPGEAFSLVIAIEPRRKVSADLGVPPLGSLCSVLTLTWRASGMTRGVHLHRLLTWTRPRAESPPVLLSVQCPAPAPSARVFPVIVTVTNASPAAANLSLSCPAPAAYDLVDLPPASAAGAGDAAAQHAPLSPSGGSLVAAADKVEVRRMVDAGSWQPALASRQAFRLMCLETRLPLGFVAAGSSVTVTLHALSPLCGMHVLDQLLVRDEVTGAAFKQARPLEVMVQ